MKTMSTVRQVSMGRFRFCNIVCFRKFHFAAVNPGESNKKYCSTCKKDLK